MKIAGYLRGISNRALSVHACTRTRAAHFFYTPQDFIKTWDHKSVLCKRTSFLKALLHCAIFRAACLATPFLQTFSQYETNCFTGVTLSNVSCNLSRFDDLINLEKHFPAGLETSSALNVALAGAENRCDTCKLQHRCFTAQG